MLTLLSSCCLIWLSRMPLIRTLEACKDKDPYSDEMLVCDGHRPWDELLPDALGLIFCKLSLQEILTVVPVICKSWKRVVSGPYCWQEINIDEWSERKPEYVDRMLKMLIPRSSGALRKLCVSGLPNDPIFSFIAHHGASLRSLELPRSEISDSIVELVAGQLRSITFLDLSYCRKIGARALEAFGKHCKSLFGLRRVMHPLEVADKVSQDDEAHAIANTMPKLRHLEVAYLLITNEAIVHVLSRCKDLEYLDVRGCWEVKLEDKFLRESLHGLKVLGPHVMDSYERNYWDDYSDFSDVSSFLAWEDGVDVFEESDDDEGVVEVRFYGGEYNDAILGFDWLSSP